MTEETDIIACWVEPIAALICGEMATRTFTLDVRQAISSQGRIRLYFTQSPYYRKPPVYGLPAKGWVFYARVQFQTDNPQGVGYLTAQAKSGRSLRILVEPGHCFFDVVCAAGLEAGDTLTVVVGDRRAGGPGAEVAHHPTYGDWQLICEVDRAGAGDFVRQADVPTLRVLPAPPEQVWVNLPSQALPGTATDLQITVVDRYGNQFEEYAGRLHVSAEGAGRLSIPEFSLRPKDRGTKRFAAAIVFAQTGIQRITVEAEQGALRGMSNPVDCAAGGDGYRIYWADLHGHSYCTDGTHSPADYYRYARTIGFLDVCALTDHDTFDQAVWEEMIETAAAAYAPGQFTTFLGYEWTGDFAQSINVLFRDGSGPYHPAYSGIRRPEEFMALTAKVDGAMVMRHDLPRPGQRWQPLDPEGELERLVQIYSFMLSNEAPGLAYARDQIDAGGCVQAALADGLRFGFIGCSDTHASMPGRRQSLTKGWPGYGSRAYGVTGIYAHENTRAATYQALYARRCYAASDRILLDFRLNGHRMGEEVVLEEPRRIFGRAVGTAPFAQVEVIKNNRVLHRAGEGETDVAFDITDGADVSPGDYYYLRAVQSDGGLAWASPIWVDPPAVR